MKKIAGLWLLICFFSLGHAQIADIIPSSISIANTGVARRDTWSVFGNPGCLRHEAGTFAAIQYENKYLLAELSGKAAHGAWCNRWVNIGAAFTHFGYKEYSDIMAGVCLARSFGRFTIGLQCNYYAAYFGDETGYRGTVFPQVGMTADITRSLTIGFHAFNPFVQKIKGDWIWKQVPALFSIGTEWRIIEALRWLVQVDKEVSSPLRVATGFEYQAIEQFGVKLGGYGSEYFVPCFGINLLFGGWRFDLNCELHPLLGLNTLGAIRYSF